MSDQSQTQIVTPVEGQLSIEDAIPEISDARPEFDAVAKDALNKAMRGQEDQIDPDVLQDYFGIDTSEPLPSDDDPESGHGAPAQQPDPEGVDADQPITVSTPATSNGPDPATTTVPDGWVDLGDGVVVPKDIADLVNWAGNITPQQSQAITDLMSGGYVLAPADNPLYANQPAASGSGPVTPTDGGGYQGKPVPPTPPTFDLSEYDPEVAKVLTAQQQYFDTRYQSLEAAIAQQNELLQQQQAIQAANEQAQSNAIMQAAIDEFTAKNNLDPTQSDTLVRSAAQLQHLPTALKKHGGNMHAAMTETLETAYWVTPALREVAIQNQLSSIQELNQDVSTRKQRASSLAGGGATVTRAPRPQPSAPLSPQQRMAAMAQEISEHMVNGQH